MIKVGIVGATGYAGVELIRLLLGHPHVAIQRLTSRAEAAVRVDPLFPPPPGDTHLGFGGPRGGDFLDSGLGFFAAAPAGFVSTGPAPVGRGS